MSASIRKKKVRGKLGDALVALSRLLVTWDQFGPPTLIALDGKPTTPEQARAALKRLAPKGFFSPKARRLLRLGREKP